MTDISDAAAHIRARPDLADQLLHAAKFETAKSLQYLFDHPELLPAVVKPLNPPSQEDGS